VPEQHVIKPSLKPAFSGSVRLLLHCYLAPFPGYQGTIVKQIANANSPYCGLGSYALNSLVSLNALRTKWRVPNSIDSRHLIDSGLNTSCIQVLQPRCKLLKVIFSIKHKTGESLERVVIKHHLNQKRQQNIALWWPCQGQGIKMSM
jgi:hypothetical protein